MKCTRLITLFSFSFALIASSLSCDEPAKSSCGDGIIDGLEDCDGSALQGATCGYLGFVGGNLGCSAQCRFDTSGCTTETDCGDGQLDVSQGEECDTTELGGVTCEGAGYYGGVPACTSECRLDYAPCELAGRCGDGLVQAGEGELCDPAAPLGFTCEQVDRLFGAAACSDDCSDSMGTCSDFTELGSPADDHVSGMAIDAAGNIYMVGYSNGSFQGRPTYGSYDLWVTMHAPDGTLVEVRTAGTEFVDGGTGLVIDDAHNLYVAGTSDGDLGGQIPAGGSDGFIMKLNPDLTTSWTRMWGSTGSEMEVDLTVDSAGNLFAATYTDGTFADNTSAGGLDVALSRFDASGTHQWTTQWGSDRNDFAKDVACDGAGDVYVTGFTLGSLDGVSAAGTFDAYLAKFSDAGALLWVRQWGTDQNDKSLALVIDAHDDVYVTGHTDDAIDGNTSSMQAFLAKYDSAGTPLWIRQWGSDQLDSGAALHLAPSGQICVVGYTEGALDGNAFAGRDDLFLTCFEPDGTQRATRQWGTAWHDFAFAVAADPSGRTFIAGTTNDSFIGAENTLGLHIYLLYAREP